MIEAIKARLAKINECLGDARYESNALWGQIEHAIKMRKLTTPGIQEELDALQYTIETARLVVSAIKKRFNVKC